MIIYYVIFLLFHASAKDEVLFHVKGSEVTVEYFESHGFQTPLIVGWPGAKGTT